MAKKGNNAHVLIIRLSAMGDVAMLVPVVLALTKTYPDLRLTLLTRARFAPMFKDISNLTVLEADVKGAHKGVFGLYRLYGILRQQQLTAIADVHHVLRSTILKLFFTFSKIPFVQIDKGRKEKRRLIRPKNKCFKALKSTHQRYADVFGKLGYPIKINDNHRLHKAPIKLEKIVLPSNKILIGIAPYAAYTSKTYPLELMRQVMSMLVAWEQVHLVLFGGGEKEVGQLNELAQDVGSSVTNVAGKLSFLEELQIISNLKLMLAMDSGNGHLAANYGVPVVTLWGVTHPFAGFAPFGQPKENSLCADRDQFPQLPTSIYGNSYPEGYETAIASIHPNTIVQRIKCILQLDVP